MTIKKSIILGLLLGLGLLTTASAAVRVVVCEDLYQEG
jgi:hypothetical protein